MILVDLVRAHIFRHSQAAMRLENFELARIICLEKITKFQARQRYILNRQKELQAKIAGGSIFTWFYKKELQRLNQERANAALRLAKNMEYSNRALDAQSHIEAKLEQYDLPVSTRIITSVTQKLNVSSMNCASTDDWLVQAEERLFLGRLSVRSYEQTLRSTFVMISDLRDKIESLTQARYCAMQAKDTNRNITKDNLTRADSILFATANEIGKATIIMRCLATNLLTLTNKLTRTLEAESELAQNIADNFKEILLKYHTTPALETNELGAVNVLSGQEVVAMKDAIEHIENIVVKSLESRNQDLRRGEIERLNTD